MANLYAGRCCLGKAVCKVLLQHGCLKPAKGREYDAKHRLPGMGHAWCYQFTPAIVELEI